MIGWGDDELVKKPEQVIKKALPTAPPKLVFEPVTEEDQRLSVRLSKAEFKISNLEENIRNLLRALRDRDAEIENLRRQTQPWNR
jgi:molecular chaperone GrpE (heat shock protein)